MKETRHTVDALIRFDTDKGISSDRTALFPATPEQVARRLLVSRRRRAHYFGDALFHDPAWDMLLELFVAQGQGKQIDAADMCAVSGVPKATAARIVQHLTATGLIAPHPDPLDAGHTWLQLSARADRDLRGFLAEEAASA